MLKEKNKLKLLDCTIRDGSYAINFNYSCKETKEIIVSLEKAGIDFIEIGHGIGLGAWRKGFKKTLCSDEDNMKIASESLSKSLWGMFAIPGICELEDIKMASSYGMKFIRIGFEPKKLKKAVNHIEEAKNSGMVVAVNFMKSYTESPQKFALIAKEVWQFGIDYIYIVDSAGGMLPEELKVYIDNVKSLIPEVKLGFHGHNNLGLALANSLVAIENGVELIDVSLMGIGRGGGNTYLEQLVAVLVKKGYDIKADLVKLMEISEKYIAKYMKALYISSIDVISGMALFHSSYMPLIKQAVEQYKVDPKYLIMEISKIEKIDVDEEIIKTAVDKLKRSGIKGDWYKFYKDYYGREQ